MAARTRLLESDMPISRIADLAGYSSLSSFSTAFKRYWGSSPKQIRNPLPVLSA
ncbi:helix-turn-helix domain-containing protein [Parapedobacter sp. 2B3]|uniref:helix-turn-helix domain-containing protein n=1 Tax=Parapedobacter sp. 2B3 TaxID=3342381 RepID=UPI0035B68099